MSLPTFKLFRPRTLEDAVGYLAKHGGNIQVLAGGTDLIPSMKQKLFTPAYLMDIRGIEELRGIRVPWVDEHVALLVDDDRGHFHQGRCTASQPGVSGVQ